MSAYSAYLQSLLARFWRYKERAFAKHPSWFDRSEPTGQRSPVFVRNRADSNVLIHPSGVFANQNEEVLHAIPRNKRHLWFGSMRSSQALAQSVFGTLRAYEKMGLLTELKGDDGNPLFGSSEGVGARMSLEHAIAYLGERPGHTTEVDVFIGGEMQVAVECKLTEQEVGTCSRPRIPTKDARFAKEYCDGRYARQRERIHRCSLTEIGVRYWECVGKLFKWSPEVDHDVCPLRNSYQLVRNVLAACVREDGHVDPDRGRAVLLFDDRNPEFSSEGKAGRVWTTVKNALRIPGILQKCTWQQVVERLRSDPDLDWLVQQLSSKYGF